MRSENKYDQKRKKLNEVEKKTIEEIEKRHRTKLTVLDVTYERHTPRATVCIVKIARWWGLKVDDAIGVSIRSISDMESPEVGRLWSFRRALEDYIERRK